MLWEWSGECQTGERGGGILACLDTPDWAAAEGFGSDCGGSGVEVVVPSPPSRCCDSIWLWRGLESCEGSFPACLSPPEFCLQAAASMEWTFVVLFSVCVFAGQTVSVCETAQLKGAFLCVDMLEACVQF